MLNQAWSTEYTIRVLIVDDDSQTQDSLKRALTFEAEFEVVGIASSGQEGVRLAQSLSPDIVLMDINMPDMDGLTATTLIATESPDAQIIIMTIQNESTYIQQAMVAGARAFLSKPVSIDDLYATIRNIYERRRPKTYRPEEPEESHVPEAHIIMVYSPQAGAGTTTIATNLAASLMRKEASVLLMDCNLYFGDVGTFLNVPARNTIADWAVIVDDVDMETVHNMVATHASGLKVLLAPRTPPEADAVKVDQVITLIKQIRTSFDFIVIDTATHLDELNVALFDLAEQILLICTPTLPAVKNVRNILDLLDAWHIDANKVQIVFNRVNVELVKAKITPAAQSIEHSLQRKAIAAIPIDERRMLSAINRGIAVVAKDRSQSPAKELIALAEVVRETLIGPAQSVLQTVSGAKSGVAHH
jgi:pilus assembly protein CpaE